MEAIINELFREIDSVPITGYLIPSEHPKEIWFPYSLEASKLLKPGMLLAVKNFNSIDISNPNKDEHDVAFSIFEVIDVKVQHYKIIDLIENPKSVKLSEEFEKFKEDWYRSIGEDEREDLKIVVYAIPHYQELHIPSTKNKALKGLNYDFAFRPSNIQPIVGEKAYLLKDKYVEIYINGKIKNSPTSFRAGKHQVFKQVDVYMDYYPLLNRHFGIFGFTGAGKSNLVSTLVSKAMLEAPSPANILIFDINNEYFGLLFDVLLKKDGHIVFITPETVSTPALDAFLRNDFDPDNVEEILHLAAIEFIEMTNFPDEVKHSEHFGKIVDIVKLLLIANKIKVLSLSITVAQFLADVFEQLENNLKGVFSGKNAQEKKRYIQAFINLLINNFASNRNLTKSIYHQIRGFIKAFKDFLNSEKEDFYGFEIKSDEQILKAIDILEDTLSSEFSKYSTSMEYEHTISVEELIQYTHDKDGSLMIFLSENDNDLRNFAYKLGKILYDIRKNKKITGDPLTLFLFEEADLFIPQKPEGEKEDKESIQRAKEIATTLARRGRKYKLGLGIATQRTAYLDTSIVAQLGTFFVSKLPRAYDRKVIADGFGIEEKQISQTSSFLPGDWMVLTHVGALHLKTTPVLISFENANNRLIGFLEEFNVEDYIQQVLDKADLEPSEKTLINNFSSISEVELFELFPILV